MVLILCGDATYQDYPHPCPRVPSLETSLRGFSRPFPKSARILVAHQGSPSVAPRVTGQSTRDRSGRANESAASLSDLCCRTWSCRPSLQRRF